MGEGRSQHKHVVADCVFPSVFKGTTARLCWMKIWFALIFKEQPARCNTHSSSSCISCLLRDKQISRKKLIEIHISFWLNTCTALLPGSWSHKFSLSMWWMLWQEKEFWGIVNVCSGLQSPHPCSPTFWIIVALSQAIAAISLEDSLGCNSLYY